MYGLSISVSFCEASSRVTAPPLTDSDITCCSQQALLEHKREVAAENDELKGHVAALTDAKTALEKDNDRLSKSSAALENERNDVQAQVTAALLLRLLIQMHERTLVRVVVQSVVHLCWLKCCIMLPACSLPPSVKNGINCSKKKVT